MVKDNKSLDGVLFSENEPHILRPNGPVLLDAQYLVSLLGGLYGRVYPDQALRIMKRELVSLKKTEFLAKEPVKG